MTSEVTVRMRHARAAGVCAKGVRAWLPRHGLSLREFLDNGYPASVISSTGDAIALRVVRAAEADKALTDGR